MNNDERKDFNCWNWSTNTTKLLIDTYKINKPKVGSYEIKNFKRLWEVIAQYISNKVGVQVSASQCENKWRVLERAYKKHLDNQNKTGQGRRYFEFLQEMDDIFKGKKNVKPVLLLSSTTVDKPPPIVVHDNNAKEEYEEPDDIVGPTPTSPSPVHIMNKRKVRRTNPVLNRNITLNNIRNDRKEYNSKRLKYEEEKLELYRQKLNVLKERNMLLAERNAILKEQKCPDCLKKLQ